MSTGSSSIKAKGHKNNHLFFLKSCIRLRIFEKITIYLCYFHLEVTRSHSASSFLQWRLVIYNKKHFCSHLVSSCLSYCLRSGALLQKYDTISMMYCCYVCLFVCLCAWEREKSTKGRVSTCMSGGTVGGKKTRKTRKCFIQTTRCEIIRFARKQHVNCVTNRKHFNVIFLHRLLFWRFPTGAKIVWVH